MAAKGVGTGGQLLVQKLKSRLNAAGGRRPKHTNPLVVRLVNIFVDAWVVLQAVNPVNSNVIEDHVE